MTASARSDAAAAASKSDAGNSDIVFTPGARRAQSRLGSSHLYQQRLLTGFPAQITRDLAASISQLDTAFLATVSAAGAPYIQHRGGPEGFIKVLDDETWASRITRGTANTSASAIYPTTTAPICSCSIFCSTSDQDLGASACGRRRSAIARTPQRPGLSCSTGARDTVQSRGMGRELLAAHNRTLHRDRDRAGHGGVARSDQRASNGERAAAGRACIAEQIGARKPHPRMTILFRGRLRMTMSCLDTASA